MNRECTFVHLKRTKRPPKDSEETIPKHNVYNRPKQPESKDHWPPLSQNSKFNSMASLSTPYPPTVDNAARTKGARNENSQSERDNSFLEKLLENLKDGIIDQMDSKIADLRCQIPSIIQESFLWTQHQAPRSRQPSGPSQIPVQPPLQPQMNLMPQAPFMIPNYPGSCF